MTDVLRRGYIEIHTEKKGRVNLELMTRIMPPKPGNAKDCLRPQELGETHGAAAPAEPPEGTKPTTP